MRFAADFHIHSCLSPCASLDMSPRAIVRQARVAGLNAIAVADHNCGRNAPALAAACRREKLACLFGIEATSAEEVHALALFDDPETAVAVGEMLHDALPDRPCPASSRDEQPVVDEHDHVTGFVERFLAGATRFSLAEIERIVHDHAGLFIPAHFARASFSLVSQLGFVPPTEAFDALELTDARQRAWLPDPPAYPLIADSDAHELADIGRVRSFFAAGSLSVTSLRSALNEGRVSLQILPTDLI